MSGTISIEPPVPLIALPKRLNAGTDRILAGCAYNIGHSRRKRAVEIPFAVDGQSISLYNVITGRLVASFPVSPQTRFLSHPMTVSFRHEDAKYHTLYTYIVCRNAMEGSDDGKLKCLLFNPKRPSQATDDGSAGASLTIPASHGKIVSLEPLPRSRSPEGFDILVFFENGDIRCLTHDLREENWQMNLISMIPDLGRRLENKLEQLHMIASPLLQKSKWFTRLLGDTDMLYTDNVEDSNSFVLGLVTSSIAKSKSGDSKTEGVHILRLHRQSSSPSSLRPTCRCIHTCRLPNDSRLESKITLHLKAGLIHRNSSEGITSWEIIRHGLGKITQSMVTSTEQPQTIPISDTHILSLDGDQLAIYDIKYGSKQSAARVARVKIETGSKRKKAEDVAIPRGSTLLDYFKQSNTALLIHDSQVFSISIHAADQKSIKRLKTGSLSASMGRGFEKSSTTSQTGELEAWQNLKDALKRRDVAQFEKAFFDAVSSTEDIEQIDVIAAYAVIQLFGNTTLGSIYDLESEGNHLAPFPKAIFQWLLTRNYLDETSANQCIHRYGSGLPSLAAADIVDSIIASDLSLNLLATYIFYSRPLPLRPLLRSIVAILRSYFEAMDVDENQDAMSETSPDKALELAEQAAAEDLSKAVFLLNETPSISRAHAIKLCINQLAVSFDTSEITRAMRAEMTTQDLTMLIELLRTEISDAGWASHCLDTYPAQPDAVESQNEALAAICRLLDCCLDALGAGGWLSGLQTTRPSEIGKVGDNSELIASLRSEASTALETVQESTFLHGFLRDFFRFDRTFQQSVSHASARGDWAKYPKLTELHSAKNPGLPLGLDTIQHIQSTKVGAGGEIKKRTKRDIGQTISKRIGKYTFEKIIL